MSYIEKEKLIKADIASIENRVRHAFNQGYDLGYKEGKEKAKPQEPTTKNDLGVDCVARQDVERFIEGFINEYTPEEELEFINLELDGLKHLPPVTPKGPTDKIFTKAELDSIVKAINSGWELRVNEVLDKIKAEILEEHENAYAREDNDTAYGLSMALDILDKYKSGGSKEA